MRIYRGFSIWFDPKQIPHRDFDFDFAHVDYDGPEDKRSGHGASVSDCQDQIDEIIYEAEG